ncbi:MAG: restriction endonuclease [bacterium]|nr:restriction endonuclease [bacterium]
MDTPYHYPPELFSLLVDTIPRLCRRKEDVFLFFRGSGVEDKLMGDIYNKWKGDRDSITKYEITRTVIKRLNELEDKAIKERREIIKRITEFDDFSTCWPKDRLEAQGLVSQIQKLVGKKDSFTRMELEKDRERQQRLEKEGVEREAIKRRKEAIDSVKTDLFKLFSIKNPQERGKELERVLNQLFFAFQIAVQESFTLTGDSGEGVIEQIDGAITVDGKLYIVEVKWWNSPLGPGEVSPHICRVYTRSDAGGIIISASDFTDAAVITCKDALHQKTIILCTLQEIVTLLEKQGELKDFLKKKIEKAILEKQPYFKPFDDSN